MGSTTHAAIARIAGAFIGTAVVATLLAAPQTSAAAGSESAASPPQAGLLARGAGYDRPNGSTRVRVVQRRLRAAGEAPGPLDGRFGPLTEAAVQRFQSRQGLAADGLVGPHTQKALKGAGGLRVGMGYGSDRESGRVRKLQRELQAAGERPGPIDGRFGPRTEDAVLHFQNRAGLAPDGVAGVATRAALDQRVKPAQQDSSKQAATGKPPTGKPATGEPTTSKPTPQQEPAPTPGRGLTAATALALAAGSALLAGILTLLTLRRRREEAPLRGRRAPAVAREGAIPATPAPEPVTAGAAVGSGPARVLGYASTGGSPGKGLNGECEEQADEIAAECERRGFSLLELVREREPRGGGVERPGLAYVLDRISAGEAEGLVVTDLSRLGRSMPELGRILEWFSRTGARLVVAAHGLDTKERGGRLVARALIDVSDWERERLIERGRSGRPDVRREGAA